MADLLRVNGLRAGYGEAIVIDDVAFEVGEGRSLALLGRNGTGKTTLLATLVGVTRHRAGSIELAGSALVPLRPDQRAAAGLGWVPQERNIFRSLTVLENLTAVARPGPWTPARAFAMFPRLGERQRNLGSQLSGGEQQMLAIARALIRDPKIILLDEPFEGLAPVIVQALMAACRELAAAGQTIVLVEQNLAATLALAHRVYIINNGHIAHEGPADEIKVQPELLQRYLGV